MKKNMFVVLVALLLAGTAWAKLPPASEEAKAKAAEAAAKAAHAGKVDAFKLCKSMDQVAATYFQQAKAAAKTVPAAAQTAACADPGIFAYAPLAAAPVAGAAVATSSPTTAPAPAAAGATTAAAATTTAAAAAKPAAAATAPPVAAKK